MAKMLKNANALFGRTSNEAYLVSANQNPIKNYVPDGPTVTNTFTNSFSQNNDDRFEHQLASRFGYGYGYESRRGGGYRKTIRNQKRQKQIRRVKSKKTRPKKYLRKSKRRN